jgi:hypothetical protein
MKGTKAYHITSDIFEVVSKMSELELCSMPGEMKLNTVLRLSLKQIKSEVRLYEM